MAQDSKEYLKILGLQPGASRDEVKRIFKELAFQYHPDRNPHHPSAEERFKEIVEAYSYLTGNTEALRALQRSTGAHKKESRPFEDILKILFDIEWQGVARKQRSLEAEVALNAEQVFRGTEENIAVQRESLCAHCQGRGVEPGAKTFTCTYCFGTGEIFREDKSDSSVECPKCNGRGILSSQGCISCRARGVVMKEVIVRVKIFPRTAPGEWIEMKGQGHEETPGKRGSLRVQVKLRPHPTFTFDGRDIICETVVSMAVAALGGRIRVPSLIGTATLTLPPGTQSGRVFRLQGMGLGGDQFVKIQVKTPMPLTERERRYLSSFQDGSQSFWRRIKKWIW